MSIKVSWSKLIDVLTNTVFLPEDEYRVTWDDTLKAVSKIAKITMMVLGEIQAGEDIEMSEPDTSSRSLEDDLLVMEIIRTLKEDADTIPF